MEEKPNNNPAEKTVIIKHEDDDDEIDLGRLFSIMFHNWKRLLIVTAGVGLIGGLCLQFLYSNPKVNYLCDFTLSIPSYQNGTLIDGTQFTISDYVTEDTLKAVKASKEEYSAVNVDKMTSGNKVSISTINVYDASDSTKVDHVYYEIKVSQNCFPNSTVAKSFLKDVTYYPLTCNLAAQKNIYYNGNFDTYSSAKTYELQISALKDQLTLLNEKYELIISTYGDFSFTNEKSQGKTVSAVLREINDHFTNAPLSDLSSELSEGGYVKSAYELASLKTEKATLTTKIADIDTQIAEVQAKIDAVTGAIQPGATVTLDLAAYTEQMAALMEEKAPLQTRISEINRKILVDGVEKTEPDDNEKTKVFAKTLEEYKTYLSTATTNLKDYNEPEAMADHSFVNYLNSSILTTTGGLNVLVIWAVPFAVGLVVAMIANGVIDHKYMHEPYPEKKKKAKAVK